MASPTLTIYNNGAISPGYYDNSWSATRSWNSTTVLFGTLHTASITFNAWGALALAAYGADVPANAYDTLSFDVYAGANPSAALAAQLYIDTGWTRAVPLNSYCGGSFLPRTWTHCSVPFSALGAVGHAFSELVVEDETGTNLAAMAFSAIQFTSSTSADAGQPDAGPPDAGLHDAGPPNAGLPDAGPPDAGPPDAGTADGGVLACVGVSSPAMAHISPGKPAFASEGAASLLTDGAYRGANAWTFTPANCSAATPCWAAVKVGAGPTRLLLDWSYQDGVGNAFDTKVAGGQTVTGYTILVSSDSTNGADGTWALSIDAETGRQIVVGANAYTQRSHVVFFAGYSWVKMAITSSTANELDELDLWDASGAIADTYFFHGDSITVRCANLRGTNVNYSEQPSFQADLQSGAGRFPEQIGGGIVNSGAFRAAASAPEYLAAFPHARNWILTMGTNDLCGGATVFATNAQAWIDAVRAAGRVPVLVHPIWGNNVASYCSANGPSFNTAVDALVAKNGLAPAVPLYEAFVGHAEDFGPGDVHPNGAGCRLWDQVFATAFK